MLNSFFPNKISFRELLSFCESFLIKNREINNPAQESIWILEKACNKKVYSTPEIFITKKEYSKILNMLKKRAILKMPLAYILGNVPFGGLTILTKHPVLIPRIETEEWIVFFISILKKNQNNQPAEILDLCSGSGCIGLLLASEFPNSNVIGVDIEKSAISLAKKNKALNNIKNANFFHGDLFSGIPKNILFDVIVANPPYVTEKEYTELNYSVTNWESKTALTAQKNGLFFYEQIISKANLYLKKNQQLGFQLALEIGSHQAKSVLKILKKNNFSGIVHKDLFGKDRAIFANKNN